MTIGNPPSMDYYVRLSAPALLSLQMAHLESAVDTDTDDAGGGVAVRQGEAASLLPCIRGYTEWVGQVQPEVSMGWDWTLTGPDELTLDRHSVRTNVMLVDEHGVDCGHRRTVEAVIGAIERCGWQPVVLGALRGD